MKIRIAVPFLAAIFLFGVGCTERQRQDYSHWKSDLIGLKRTVTLYANNGQPIKTWKGRYKVEVSNGIARFMDDGRAVMIAGTFVIEEEK